MRRKVEDALLDKAEEAGASSRKKIEKLFEEGLAKEVSGTLAKTGLTSERKTWVRNAIIDTVVAAAGEFGRPNGGPFARAERGASRSGRLR